MITFIESIGIAKLVNTYTLDEKLARLAFWLLLHKSNILDKTIYGFIESLLAKAELPLTIECLPKPNEKVTYKIVSLVQHKEIKLVDADKFVNSLRNYLCSTDLLDELDEIM